MTPTPLDPPTPPQRIDLRHATDTADWCRIFGVDTHQLRHAVQQVGPQAAAVRRFLEQRAESQRSA